MPVVIPERLKDLLTGRRRLLPAWRWSRATALPRLPRSGSIMTACISSSIRRGRVKDRIMHHHPAVAFVILDPHDSYRYLEIRGRVVEETEEGGNDRICDLNLKYHGNRNYPLSPGQVRVTYKVLAEHVFPDK